ncbi:nucleotidyl transferase AbiEii/AbiGii toxin family protein [Amycolatopsis minnesotensis]|uniref:Nucleotidyl transferase AbiEii toxin, Type IV TA system n=1 Tax=Amycolatopsis minnesotensis TaxID=337894 RepID=A0ABP5BE00_9PSEU
MLDPDEESAIAERFGVARAQVRRDHLISHLLAVLSANLADEVLFFGGTALSRSFAPGGRLSEDIDLIALTSRGQVAAALDHAVRRGTRREFPGLTWEPALTDVRDVDPAVIRLPDGTTVRVQLLGRTGYPPWPTERRDLVQRYSDATAASLTIPAIESFAAWKTAAWVDRAAPRDLFDLWLLAGLGALDQRAGALFKRFGPVNRLPGPEMFTSGVDEERWRRELSGQTRLTVTAEEARTTVAAAWARLAR